MKKLTLTSLILLAGLTQIYATDYEKSVKKGIEMLQSSTTIEACNSSTNYFERLAEMHKSEWLPLYYAAYGSLKAGIQQENSDTKDEYYKKGLSFIQKAKSIQPNESEIFAMEAYLKLMYISNDAMKRAPAQTAEAMELIETAKAMNPNNPRPWFVQGQNTLFTPSFFGGGATNAKPLLEKAVSLYKSFKPENELMPVWGKERCEKLLEKCR